MQADPGLQSWDLRTSLHVAAQHRQPAVIREILLDPHVRCQLAGNPTQPSDPPLGNNTPASSNNLANITQPSSNYMCLSSEHQDQLPPAPSVSGTVNPNPNSQHSEQQPAVGIGEHTEHMQLAEADTDKDKAQLQAAVEGLHALRSAHLQSVMSSHQEASPEQSGAMHAQLSSVTSNQAAAADPYAMHKADAGIHEAEASSMGGGIEDDDNADALDALLWLTADCSMQSPRKEREPSLCEAGEPGSTGASKTAECCLLFGHYFALWCCCVLWHEQHIHHSGSPTIFCLHALSSCNLASAAALQQDNFYFPIPTKTIPTPPVCPSCPFTPTVQGCGRQWHCETSQRKQCW